MRRTILLVLALAAAALAAAPAAQAGSITPTSGVYLGAFANEPGGIATLESDIGRHLALDRSYMPWTFTGWANRIAPLLVSKLTKTAPHMTSAVKVE